MKLLATSLLGLFAAGGALSAQGKGPDPKAVDAIFARHDHTTTPGCALGVFQDGRIAYSRGYGMADLNHGVPITPSTVFYLASVSKQFAAFAIALLAEEGGISLEDPVRKWVPELPAYTDPIRVRHLVHHTSGIRDYLGLWSLSGRPFTDEIPQEAAIELISRQRSLDFAPGSRYSYSNSGYILMAEIVKRATGMSLRQYAEAKMFGPLGMRRTHFHDDNSVIVPGRAESYDRRAEGYRAIRSSYALVGDGGLLSSIDDLLQWDNNFYQNRLGGGQALIDRVQTPGGLDSAKATYAFGLVPGTYRGLATVAHGGAMFGFRTNLVRFPSERLTVAVLCNDGSANPTALTNQVADLYLAGKLGPAPEASPSGPPAQPETVPITARQAAAYVGRYVSDELDTWTVVEARGDTVTARTRWGDPVQWRPIGPDAFMVGWVRIDADRDRRGQVTGFRLSAARTQNVAFVKAPPAPRR
ncbi:MAG: beta-lactamase family protein [Gemmatimonadales bacterium]|nr:beta-lactamase family protein [Gemmatimonadales bacterium]